LDLPRVAQNTTRASARRRAGETQSFCRPETMPLVKYQRLLQSAVAPFYPATRSRSSHQRTRLSESSTALMVGATSGTSRRPSAPRRSSCKVAVLPVPAAPKSATRGHVNRARIRRHASVRAQPIDAMNLSPPPSRVHCRHAVDSVDMSRSRRRLSAVAISSPSRSTRPDGLLQSERALPTRNGDLSASHAKRFRQKPHDRAKPQPLEDASTRAVLQRVCGGESTATVARRTLKAR